MRNRVKVDEKCFEHFPLLHAHFHCSIDTFPCPSFMPPKGKKANTSVIAPPRNFGGRQRGIVLKIWPTWLATPRFMDTSFVSFEAISPLSGPFTALFLLFFPRCLVFVFKFIQVLIVLPDFHNPINDLIRLYRPIALLKFRVSNQHIVSPTMLVITALQFIGISHILFESIVLCLKRFFCRCLIHIRSLQHPTTLNQIIRSTFLKFRWGPKFTPNADVIDLESMFEKFPVLGVNPRRVDAVSKELRARLIAHAQTVSKIFESFGLGNVIHIERQMRGLRIRNAVAEIKKPCNARGGVG